MHSHAERKHTNLTQKGQTRISHVIVYCTLLRGYQVHTDNVGCIRTMVNTAVILTATLEFPCAPLKCGCSHSNKRVYARWIHKMNSDAIKHGWWLPLQLHFQPGWLLNCALTSSEAAISVVKGECERLKYSKVSSLEGITGSRDVAARARSAALAVLAAGKDAWVRGSQRSPRYGRLRVCRLISL